MKKTLSLIIMSSLVLSACSAIPPNEETLKSHPAESQESSEIKPDGHANLEKGEISPEELTKKIQAGEKFILLDVREQEEYEDAHIKGTTDRISVKELSEDSLQKAGINKNDEIVVYCRSGNRSRTAANQMRNLGYSNVRELNSGIIHWIEDGFPTESGAENFVTDLSKDNTQAAEGPHIAFDRDSHDFGQVPQFGGNVQTTFQIRNTGNSTLEIGEITTSCSCTSASLEQKSIAPGAEATLTVTFNPNLHEEPLDTFKRTIFIPTNDSTTPEAELSISVDILEGK